MTTIAADQSVRDEVLKNNFDYTLFSWSKQKGIDPLCIERAEGSYLYDYSGKRYLDFSSGLMNVNIGHGDKRVAEAVMQQMNELCYVVPGVATRVRGELGKKLAEICPPGVNKAYFTLDGASSIENAMKLARMITGRHKILARYRAFHGTSYGAMAAGGDPRKFAVDAQQAPNIVHLEDPYCYRCPWSQQPQTCALQCASHVERIVEFEGPQNIAAIIMEGESGSSGCIKYPKNYWKRMREICDKHDILLIADEVMSGFGRTGAWFGVDNHGVVPDMICMAKGITAGYVPFGCLMVKESLVKKFDDTPLMLGMTYSAHPVSCAAALATIKIYETDNLIERCRQMSAYFEKQMRVLIDRHPCIGDFRNTGLLGVIEIVKNRDSREPMAPFNAGPAAMAVMNEVGAMIKSLGMTTFLRWNYIFVAPPLTVSEAEIDEGLAIISKALGIADKHCIA